MARARSDRAARARRHRAVRGDTRRRETPVVVGRRFGFSIRTVTRVGGPRRARVPPRPRPLRRLLPGVHGGRPRLVRGARRALQDERRVRHGGHHAGERERARGGGDAMATRDGDGDGDGVIGPPSHRTSGRANGVGDPDRSQQRRRGRVRGVRRVRPPPPRGGAGHRDDAVSVRRVVRFIRPARHRDARVARLVRARDRRRDQTGRGSNALTPGGEGRDVRVETALPGRTPKPDRHARLPRRQLPHRDEPLWVALVPTRRVRSATVRSRVGRVSRSVRRGGSRVRVRALDRRAGPRGLRVPSGGERRGCEGAQGVAEEGARRSGGV
mmetsp:Transcript_11255/g.45431  ORF Transcript_11255/g.45431 Transcript_11255/m.45431 type:complete len:327 (+) Transcript_11255:505-1485(+)